MGFYFSFQLCCLLLLASTRLGEGKTVSETFSNVTKTDEQKYHELSVQIEEYFKKSIRYATKIILPYVIALQGDPQISDRCMQSVTKYTIGLSRAKIWAVQMLDATSKVPSGILIGTFAEFGSFDECLNVKSFNRDGSLDFQGSSCTLEVKPLMPPLKKKFSLARVKPAESGETLRAEMQKSQPSINQKPIKLTLCVPSTCSIEDVRYITKTLTNGTDFQVNIPVCYVQKETEILPIHIVVFATLSILLILGISGSVFEAWKKYSGAKIESLPEKVLASFSLSSNFRRLTSTSGGSEELKCLHGIKALGILWVILAHTYIYMDFQTLKDPIYVQSWFGTISFEFISNGWLSVDVFFLISGMLVTYGNLKGMAKTQGKLNLPLQIFRRYIRLTPSVLLSMGLIFCLPLISSGPFWYQHMEDKLELCRKYWWTNLLYFFNWWGINKACIQTTWYVAADMQLHIFSLFLLLVLFRYAKAGIGSLVVSILVSCSAIAAQTWYWDLAASVQLSTGDDNQVYNTVDKIHIQTFTHLGPHCIGMALGYYILKNKEKKYSKLNVVLGWCISIVLCMCAVLGSHRFAAGKESSEALTIFYAAIHRCVFSIGLAWVLLACIKGYGGPVNAFLSSKYLEPIGKLTFMIYLIHPLVMWLKLGSMRERVYASHYEFIYLFIAHSVTSIAMAVPFYLLLEAPVSIIERLLTDGTKKASPKPNPPNLDDNPKTKPSDIRVVTLPELFTSEKSNS